MSASWSVINRTLHSTLKAKTVSGCGVDFDLIRRVEDALQIEDNCTNVRNTVRSPTKVGVVNQIFCTLAESFGFTFSVGNRA